MVSIRDDFVSRGSLGIWGEIFDFPTRGRVPGHSGLNPRMQVSKLQSTGQAPPQGSIHPMSTVVKLRNMVLHKIFSQNQYVYESLGNLIIKYRFWFGRTRVAQRFCICNNLPDVVDVAGLVIWKSLWVLALWSSVRVRRRYFPRWC